MSQHRRKSNVGSSLARRSRRERDFDLCRATFEALEERRLLTALAGGDIFEFQQAPGTLVHINVNGDTQAEFVGAVVDDQNNIILTDLPGVFRASASGRGNARQLGGVGGAKGVVTLGTTPISNPGGIGNFNLVDVNNDINLNAIASNNQGDTYAINVGTARAPVVLQDTKVVQLVQMATGGGNAGAGTVVTNINEAQLLNDIMSTLSTNIGTVGDVAIDQATGTMYVVADTGNNSILYSIDRTTGVVTQVGPIRYSNGGTKTNVGGIKAMAFATSGAKAGHLYAIVPDYDGNANADSDNLLLSATQVPLPSPPNPPGATGPDVSNLDSALVDLGTVGAFNLDFTNANINSIVYTATTFSTDQTFTSMTWDAGAGNFLATVPQHQTNAGGGGGAGTLPPMELDRVTVTGGVTTIGVLAGAGGGGGNGGSGGPQIDGLAFSQNIAGATILVGLDHNANANGAGGGGGGGATITGIGQLVSIDTKTAAVSALGVAGDYVGVAAGGLASYTEPGDVKPLLFTTDGASVIRGSSVSLPVDPADGKTLVDHATAATFNPMNGLLYFVVAEAPTGTGQGQASYDLYSVDVAAGSPSQVLNSLVRAPGNFANAQIDAIAIDQTSPTDGLLMVVDNTSGKLGALAVTDQSIGNLNTNGTGFSANPVQLNCNPLLGAGGPITGLEFWGDQPDVTLGQDPENAEQFIYAIQNAGGNSAIYRIRIDGNTPTAMFWGSLPDPDDTVGPIRGENIQDVTFNPGLLDPFTQRMGALIATDVDTDEMLYVDPRLRPQVVNIFHIEVAQSDAAPPTDVGSQIIIGEWDPNAAPAPRMIPYTNDIGQLRVNGVPGDLVSADANTGGVLIGLKTVLTNCDPGAPPNDLIPLTQADLTHPFGMIPVGDGVLHAGIGVSPNVIANTKSQFEGRMLGSNLDSVTAISVRDNGQIAIIDSDRTDANDAVIGGDEIAIKPRNSAVANTPVAVVDALNNPLFGVQAIDWGDPHNTGTQSLYAVYVIGNAATLGTIDPVSGVFTEIGPIGAGIAGVQAMAFSPAGLLYVVDTNSTLYRIDPDTGAVNNVIGTVTSLAGPVVLKSMDFDASGNLIGEDIDRGRLVSINPVNAQAGAYLTTDNGSLRATIGGISYDPFSKRWVAVDNALSREALGPVGNTFGEATHNESATIVELTPIPTTNTTGLPINTARVEDLDRLMIGGAVTGHVNISGSINLFYAGWLLTGVAAGQPMLVPFDPGNFKVGGELRNLVTIDSIGTDDATALDQSIYTTGFDMVVGGKVGQITTRTGDLMGSVTVTNDPNAPTLPASLVQQEVEFRANPATVPPESVFASGVLMSPDGTTMFDNDTFDTPQFLGVINDPTLNTGKHPTNGVNAVHVQGELRATAQIQDFIDFYAVSLMAGQTIVVQEINPLNGVNVGVLDPDGRVIATDYSDQDASQYYQHRFAITATKPGLYRFVIAASGNGAFDPADTTVVGVQPYDLMITGVGNVGMGAAHAAQNVFDGRVAGTQFAIGNGDLGAVYAGVNFASLSTPTVQDETYAGAPQDALVGATVDVLNGNIRTLDAGQMGRDDTSLGPTIHAFNGGVGLVQTRTGVMNLNSNVAPFGAPRVSDHEAPGVSRDVAVGDDIQLVSSAGTFFGALLTNKAIGTVRAVDFASQSPSMFIANADQQGDDGIIDLIDSEGDFGTQGAGGPAIETGPGGNLRYLFVRGNTFRDQYFGSGLPAAPEETNFLPGETARLTDDSGADVTISPVPGAPIPAGGTAPALHIVTYGVRGSGGSAIVNVRSDDSVSIRGTSDSVDAPVEIGHIEVNGTGTAPVAAAGGRLTLPAAGARLIVQIDGTTPVDVYSIDGANFTTLANNSKGVDPDTGKTVLGEFVNINAATIGILSAGNIGVPKSATAAEPGGATILANTYPFASQRTAIISGDIVQVRATGAIANLVVDGTISQLVADADNKRNTGAFEGIVGPVFVTGQLPDVTIGAGIANGGNGNLALAGIFAEDAIGQIRGKNAHIYGPIVSTNRIDRITLTGSSSIRNADILAVAQLDMAREFSGKTTQGPSDNINNPTYQIGTIYLSETTPKKKQAFPPNGGIIGAYIAGADIGTTRTTHSFGIINSTFGIIANGRIKDFLTDGYGMRDVNIVAGASVGRMIVAGNGENLPVTQFSPEERYSETSEFDPITGFEPNRTTDLHVYMNTTKNKPTADGTTNAGVIAGTTVKASRDLTLVQAWRIQHGVDSMGSQPTDFDVANSIKTITTRQDAEDVQITTGKLGTMTIGRDLRGPSITVSGVFSKLYVKRDFIPDTIPNDLDIIQAKGANGQISSIFIGRNMRGTISAFKKIGKVTVKGAFTGAVFQHGVQILP